MHGVVFAKEVWTWGNLVERDFLVWVEYLFFFGHVAAAGFARELLALGRGWGGSFEGLVTKNSKQDCLVGCCMGCLFGGKYRWG